MGRPQAFLGALCAVTACGAEQFRASLSGGGAGGQFGIDAPQVDSPVSSGAGGSIGGGVGSGGAPVSASGSGAGGAAPPLDAPIDLGGSGGARPDAPAEARADIADRGPPDAGDPCAPVAADGGVGGAANCDCETFGGHAYRFCKNGRAFDAAETECVAHGMRLIRLDSDAENTWAYNTKKAKAMMTTWIGATDAVTEGDWRWVDNTPFWTGKGATAGGKPVGGHYQRWDVPANEPNQVGNEDCAGYWYQIPTWADLTCTDLNAYICETY